jgi:hypothetical protein
MATTKTTYTANGTNKLFAFTFPYFFPADIKVQLNGVNTTAYTFANATTVEMNTAPASGVKVSIYRDTNSDQMNSEFYPGSAIRAQDLNDNYNQVLYVVQENETLAAETDEKSALAISTASGAVSTANVALSQSTAAVNTANVASATATSAVSTSNAANATAASAVTTANGAVTTANTKGDAAIASAATANTKADQAISAVSNSINYQLVSNVAGIPATPADDTYIEIGNSTGLQSFTPLVGLPVGFVGDSGLTVRLRYTTTGATWNFQNYYANNAETRYLKLAGGTLTGPLTLAGAPTSNLHPATKSYVDGYVGAINGDIGSLSSTKLDSSTAASTYQPLSGMSSYLTTATASSTYAALGNAQSFTKAQRGTPVALTDAATVAVDLSLSNHYTLGLGGNRTLGAPTNQTAGQSGVIVITNGGANTLAFASVWKFPGGTAPTVTASGTDVLAYYVESSSRITARIVSDVK